MSLISGELNGLGGIGVVLEQTDVAEAYAAHAHDAFCAHGEDCIMCGGKTQAR